MVSSGSWRCLCFDHSASPIRARPASPRRSTARISRDTAFPPLTRISHKGKAFRTPADPRPAGVPPTRDPQALSSAVVILDVPPARDASGNSHATARKLVRPCLRTKSLRWAGDNVCSRRWEFLQRSLVSIGLWRLPRFPCEICGLTVCRTYVSVSGVSRSPGATSPVVFTSRCDSGRSIHPVACFFASPNRR